MVIKLKSLLILYLTEMQKKKILTYIGSGLKFSLKFAFNVILMHCNFINVVIKVKRLNYFVS